MKISGMSWGALASVALASASIAAPISGAARRKKRLRARVSTFNRPPADKRPRWALAEDGDSPANRASSSAWRAEPSIKAHIIVLRFGSASKVAIWLMQGACSMNSLPVESFRLLLGDILTSNVPSAKTWKPPQTRQHLRSYPPSPGTGCRGLVMGHGAQPNRAWLRYCDERCVHEASASIGGLSAGSCPPQTGEGDSS
ncbi:hypothetical protein D3C71_1050510 [compost metagenome]